MEDGTISAPRRGRKERSRLTWLLSGLAIVLGFIVTGVAMVYLFQRK